MVCRRIERVVRRERTRGLTNPPAGDTAPVAVLSEREQSQLGAVPLRGSALGIKQLFYIGRLMKIKKITIDPDPYEPFRLAQGYRVGELLFISGQAAIDGNGQLVGVGNFDVQAAQVFANLERVLRAGGSSLANVIKVTIFLRDMSNFPKIVELRGRYFTPPYPADTIVEVTSLYSPDALIEIEAIAVVNEAVEES
jgi:2-iminobutanoate/2-iminopropanoate deaminase